MNTHCYQATSPFRARFKPNFAMMRDGTEFESSDFNRVFATLEKTGFHHLQIASGKVIATRESDGSIGIIEASGALPRIEWQLA